MYSANTINVTEYITIGLGCIFKCMHALLLKHDRHSLTCIMYNIVDITAATQYKLQAVFCGFYYIILHTGAQSSLFLYNI